jgi:hypothetical protein
MMTLLRFFRTPQLAVLMAILGMSHGLFAQLPANQPAIDLIRNFFVASLSKSMSEEQRAVYRDRFFAIPDMQGVVAGVMGDLAEKSIYRGARDELSDRFRVLERKSQALKSSGSVGENAAMDELVRVGELLTMENKKRDQAWLAISELRELIEGLAYMRDQRVIRFIGPLLAVDGFVYDGGDFAAYPPEHVAAGAVRRLGRSGVVPVPEDVSEWNVPAARRWWADNRLRYGPIPERLKAIDGGSLSKPNAGAPASN